MSGKETAAAKKAREQKEAEAAQAGKLLQSIGESQVEVRDNQIRLSENQAALDKQVAEATKLLKEIGKKVDDIGNNVQGFMQALNPETLQNLRSGFELNVDDIRNIVKACDSAGLRVGITGKLKCGDAPKSESGKVSSTLEIVRQYGTDAEIADAEFQAKMLHWRVDKHRNTQMAVACFVAGGLVVKFGPNLYRKAFKAKDVDLDNQENGEIFEINQEAM